MADDSHHNDSDSLPVYFRDLRGQNPQHIIDAFSRANPGPVTNAITASLGALSHMELRSLIERLISTLSDSEFRNQFLRAITQHIRNHPYQTAFIVVGVILLMNPLALVGFGSLGPVAGEYLPSVCASDRLIGWRRIGCGRLASQYWRFCGRRERVRHPTEHRHGGSGCYSCGWCRYCRYYGGGCSAPAGGANAAGGEVARWWGGDYGEPVKNWWNGNFGQPVKSWLGATEKPVANWWGQVTRQNTAQN
jgi:hypothetical protein